MSLINNRRIYHGYLKAEYLLNLLWREALLVPLRGHILSYVQHWRSVVTGNTNQITVPNGLKSICNIPLQECKFQSSKHDWMTLLIFFIFVKWIQLKILAHKCPTMISTPTMHCYKLPKHSQQGFYKIHKGWFFTGLQTALKSLIFKCFSVCISVLKKKKNKPNR